MELSKKLCASSDGSNVWAHFLLSSINTPSNQLRTNVQWHVEELTDWQNSRIYKWNVSIIIIILLFKCMTKCFAAGMSHAFI